MGEYVDLFEQKIKKYCNSEYAIAVNSGTSALHLALKSVGVKKDDIVFVSDLSFIASVNPVLYEGAIPVFIDSEEDGNMSVDALKLAFTKYKPKALIVVSVYGTCAKLKEIRDICDNYDCVMIEDSTEALGSFYKGKMAGTYGHIGCYSFNGNKIITTSCGGMCVTDIESYAKKIKHFATQCRNSTKYYSHDDIGYNYRMSNICAAIGVGQIEKIDKKIKLKNKIHNYYAEYFKDNKYIDIFSFDSDRKNNYWISCASLKNVKPIDLIDFLQKKGIEARTFWKPLHTQEYYNFSFIGDGVSSILFDSCICLPSDTNMTKKEMKYVCVCIDEYLRSKNV